MSTGHTSLLQLNHRTVAFSLRGKNSGCLQMFHLFIFLYYLTNRLFHVVSFKVKCPFFISLTSTTKKQRNDKNCAAISTAVSVAGLSLSSPLMKFLGDERSRVKLLELFCQGYFCVVTLFP